MCELSIELKQLLEDEDGDDLSRAIVDLLARSEVLYRSAWAASSMVYRVSDQVVVKITDERYAVTEHSSLLYLQEHLPSFPAPRSHGVVRIGIFCLLFTTFVTGLDLEKAWPQLGDIQKHSISGQLDALFSQLRSLPFPENMPLGGVQGEGCKDGRRGLRVNSEPIMNVKQFDEWVFTGSKTASPVYTRLLRSLVPATIPTCVFTHGDIRPANIMVDKLEDGTWKIIAVIDWAASGFYPDYWESVKATNNLTPRDDFDWYEYLPESISPSRCSTRWLVDRLWDRNMENSS